jgi:regulator of replication initiation timing
MTLDQQFNILNEKLQLLLKQHHRLQRENEKLREELQLVRSHDEEWKKKVESLEQQVSILKLGAGDMSEQDKKDFEKKINQYLRDIDKCISFLSQ